MPRFLRQQSFFSGDDERGLLVKLRQGTVLTLAVTVAIGLAVIALISAQGFSAGVGSGGFGSNQLLDLGSEGSTQDGLGDAEVATAARPAAGDSATVGVRGSTSAAGASSSSPIFVPVSGLLGGSGSGSDATDDPQGDIGSGPSSDIGAEDGASPANPDSPSGPGDPGDPGGAPTDPDPDPTPGPGEPTPDPALPGPPTPAPVNPPTIPSDGGVVDTPGGGEGTPDDGTGEGDETGGIEDPVPVDDDAEGETSEDGGSSEEDEDAEDGGTSEEEPDTEEVSEVEIPEVVVPEVSDVEISDVALPDVEVPDVKVPEFD